MSDGEQEFDLKKKKKKSKKVDFDAFEEDAAGGNDDGVAATAEKIEDLDRAFLRLCSFSLSLSRVDDDEVFSTAFISREALSHFCFSFTRALLKATREVVVVSMPSLKERAQVSFGLFIVSRWMDGCAHFSLSSLFLSFSLFALSLRANFISLTLFLSLFRPPSQTNKQTKTFENNKITVEEFGKKKKSKKKKKLALSDDEEGENDGENATTSSGGGGVQSGLGLPWDGSDRDYHYDELLGRVFGILKEKNPALSEKTKTIIKPPQIAREGTKKTVFANLMEICNAMHRPHEHVTQYMMAELGTTGTLDGQQRLIIKGRFLPKVFEGVLRHYFIDYVICNMCKSSDTQLVKEATTRLSYCRCQSCGASRSVSNIQKGYTAVGRGERRKARAMGT
jgi:translation initiation factor 2 subunit 2